MSLLRDKPKSEIIAHWRKVLANPNAAPIAHLMAREAIEELTRYAAQTAPITQADPTRGVDERS